jgi:hypothetical protein
VSCGALLPFWTHGTFPPRLDFDSDEELEAALRRELIEIVCSKAVGDPETLLDLVLARLCGEAVDPSTD